MRTSAWFGSLLSSWSWSAGTFSRPETPTTVEKLFDRAGMPPELKKEGKKLLSGNIAESVSYLHAAVDRLSGIIDSLLRLSRAGRVQFQWQTVDVGAIVDKVVAAASTTASTPSELSVVRSLPKAWGDPTAVEQIFANLLDNAVSYVDPARPGRIEVGDGPPERWRGPAQPAGLLCEGQRAGHSAGLSHRVFTAFNRLHPSVAQGEGIGLALVRRMVERTAARSGWSRPASARRSSWPSRPGRMVQECPIESAGSTRKAQRRESLAMTAEPILIVLVEDDDGHATLVERNLVRVGVANRSCGSRTARKRSISSWPGRVPGRRPAQIDPAPAGHQDAAGRRRRGARASSRPMPDRARFP